MTTTPRQRRHDPVSYTSGWEIAVAAIAVVTFVLAGGALLGVGLGSWIFGNGWAWPSGPNDIALVLRGLLTGNPERGFPPDVARLIAPATAVYGSVIVCDAALVCALSWIALRMRRRFHNDGMATRSEAREALGARSLHDAWPIIRPDQHAPARLKRRR